MTAPLTRYLAALLLIVSLVAAHEAVAREEPAAAESPSVLVPLPPLRMNLDDRIGDIEIVDEGDHLSIIYEDMTLSPAQYLGMIAAKQDERDAGGILFKTFNITSWAGVTWIAIGLLGQLLFTGRMLTQWIISEKERRSVVPPVFWYFSLGGAAMLLAYFIWRKDLVGILGQATGFFIYIRNVYLIYAKPRPAPEPLVV